ncbi:hypothetical protein [Bacillus sp. ISL-37]|uniref:hypothetical protein n=1 Tax=Bacillus sp. ISL-37 TaxID=2819123 RepID=UPI001BE76D1B|nr:hypothetical protein [Bacillus sp. ISL-37]MBT2685061.1 hypothetical protein [Bacillus sp. ISL-37]
MLQKEKKEGKRLKNVLLGLVTLLVALIVIPMMFNYWFLWDSGEAKGVTSDWFTLYGNIFGGLIGGFFTYLALLLTFKEQKENKKEDMRPRIDIPYQRITFSEDKFEPIIIELNNIGGSVAKNIQCKLSLPNYEEVISILKTNQSKFEIEFEEFVTKKIANHDVPEIRSIAMYNKNKEGKRKSLGAVYKDGHRHFVGSCIPMILNHDAKIQYRINDNVSKWITQIVSKRSDKFNEMNEKEMFLLNLEVTYSSIKYGTFVENFILEWKYTGIEIVEPGFKFVFVLKSTLSDEKTDKTNSGKKFSVIRGFFHRLMIFSNNN